ncbi:antibiotic biosynthesis monooxygenase [Streptomyces sp. NPDC005969]|uniref:antibiotic biosynthesis monooxygenase family protein n=1 Tax=Streptomyces sp. NPDC005969 TaxID=3156722 RepID=UPI0033E7D2EF
MRDGQAAEPGLEYAGFAQFKEETGPIVLANTFLVPKERTEAFLTLFRRQAEFMKAQPGFVSLQMYKATASSRLLTGSMGLLLPGLVIIVALVIAGVAEAAKKSGNTPH